MSKLLQIFKYPLSWLYMFFVWLRNVLFDAHILISKQAVLPTLCVGNLAVGGTGKTPHIEWLINRLLPYFKIAVVSRGYKRKTSGLVFASQSSTAADIGDECMQLHTKFPELIIAVCKNRHKAIEQIKIQHPEVQLVLLDDAFQYRHLKADFNILLTTADNPYSNDRMLPLGTLRDSRMERQRADVIIVTKCPENLSPIEKRNITISLRLLAYQHLFFSIVRYAPLPDELAHLKENSRIILLTGIADPQPLVGFLSERHKNIIHIRYPDHHNFTEREIKSLSEQSENADVVITTEKDFARLAQRELPEQLSGKLYPIAIYPEITDSDDLLRLIISRLTKLYQQTINPYHNEK